MSVGGILLYNKHQLLVSSMVPIQPSIGIPLQPWTLAQFIVINFLLAYIARARGQILRFASAFELILRFGKLPPSDVKIVELSNEALIAACGAVKSSTACAFNLMGIDSPFDEDAEPNNRNQPNIDPVAPTHSPADKSLVSITKDYRTDRIPNSGFRRQSE